MSNPKSDPPQLEPGSTLSAKFKVLDTDLASATSPDASDTYAHVLATPRLVAFMEIVCARMLVPFQTPGHLSVGTRVEMDHLAATGVGEEIVVESKFVGKDREGKGKVFLFECEISDKGGVVGRGKHGRAVIEEGRLIDGARKRGGRVGGGSKI